jgi:hypothetical protein
MRLRGARAPSLAALVDLVSLSSCRGGAKLGAFERRSTLAPLALNREIHDARRTAVGCVIDQPREGGKRDTGGARVTSSKRTGETVRESAPHVGAEGRKRRSSRGHRRSCDRPPGVVGRVVEGEVEERRGGGVCPTGDPSGST